jgi:hypothetical protein
VELRILATPQEQAGLLNLPWDTPLEDWPAFHLVALPRGISRHVVRFVRINRRVYAIKEIVESFAMREYGLLRELQRLRLPTVVPVGVVGGRQSPTGEVLDAALITRHLEWSLPYRAVFSDHLQPDTVDRLVDALVALFVKLHLFGFAWNDCSLSNTLFRRDAGAFAAYLVDAETGEMHRELSAGQRQHDLDTATLNIAGEFLDLAAGERLDPTLDPVEVARRVPERYERLWDEVTGTEEFDVNDLWRITRRMERLNELGFDVDELDVVTDIGGRTVRLRPKVVDVGHHRARLMRLTGIDAQENQARRLLNDLDAYRAATDQQGEDEAIVAHEWVTRVYRPVQLAVPRELRGKLEPAEVFHEVLEHRWYLSQRLGREVSTEEAAHDYVETVLRHRPDEAAVLGRAVRARDPNAPIPRAATVYDPGAADAPDDMDATQPFRVPWDELDEH